MPSGAGLSSPAAALAEALENSARLIDRHLQDDRCFPDLSELLSVPSHSKSWRERLIISCQKFLFTLRLSYKPEMVGSSRSLGNAYKISFDLKH